jgi:hypothetical protein
MSAIKIDSYLESIQTQIAGARALVKKLKNQQPLAYDPDAEDKTPEAAELVELLSAVDDDYEQVKQALNEWAGSHLL